MSTFVLRVTSPDVELHIVREAMRIGYSEMRLDTLSSMREALSLYEKVGFTPIEPYYETPIAGTVFLAKPLVA